MAENDSMDTQKKTNGDDTRAAKEIDRHPPNEVTGSIPKIEMLPSESPEDS
jgi:hypothetical protein